MKNFKIKKFNAISLGLIISMNFFSCEKENSELQESKSLNTAQLGVHDIIGADGQTEHQEIAYPEKSGEIQKLSFNHQTITIEEIDGEYVYEGDIIIDKNINSKTGSNGRSFYDSRWTSNIVYYSIDSDLERKYRVTDAIAHWESETNVEFIERTNQYDYIRFTVGKGCSSYVGRQGGSQNITLADGCSTGNTIHEIGHALGLWHEQSRSDRDKYIKINFENISENREHNFYTYQQNYNDGKELTKVLDLGSIMMYPPYAFSKNGAPTITRKNGKLFKVQRDALSKGDIIGIAEMYPSLISPWLTGNRNGDSRGRKDTDSYVTGLSVRDEAGYGIVNASLLNYGGSTSWTTTNIRGDLKTVKFASSSAYAVGIEVVEQDNYGVVDIRLISQLGTKTDWVTNNSSKVGRKTSTYLAPEGKQITALEAQEQGNYGIVDLRVFIK